MTKQTALTVIALSVATLILGGAIGRYTASLSPEEAKARYQLVEQSKLSELASRVSALEVDLKAADAERGRLQNEKEALATQVERLDKDLNLEREKARVAAVEPEGKLSLAFGAYADMDALTKADWPEMGGAVKAMNSLFLDLIADVEKGKPISADLQKKIASENAKLVRLAAGIMGKIPTHAPVNGEFSHPLVLANLLSAALDESGLSLTPAQKAAAARAGSGYDEAYEKLQKGYTPESTELEKMVDELALKQECVKRLRETLSPQQLEAVLPPELRDRMQLDVLSPGISTILSAQPKSYKSAEEARSQFQQKLLKDLDVDTQVAGTFDEPFTAWQEEVAPLLSQQSEKEAGPPRFDQALLAARAEVNLLRRLLATPGLSDKARETILAMRAWTVPQISAKKE